MNSLTSSTTGLGVAAGLCTAVLWTGTAVCFEAASKRLGSLAVNVLRLALALVFFVALSLLRTHRLWAGDLSSQSWFYLGLSGVVGFVVGDVLLFQAFVLIGARLSMLIYASVPFMTAIAGFVFLDERMSRRAVEGMAITVAGIALAVAGGRSPGAKDRGARRVTGVLMAFGGAAGQAAGLLLGKRGALGLDSFAATQIRAFFGFAGFLLVAVAARQLGRILGLVKVAVAPGGLVNGDRARLRTLRFGLVVMAIGALLGPFLGVSLGLLSTQLLPTGIASTLMSTVPVLLIPVSALSFRERISLAEIGGALLAVAGVAVLAQ
ncbi:MAG TPA: DMT family transporter [Polyangia bacterium]